jgi:hypothetical protein
MDTHSSDDAKATKPGFLHGRERAAGINPGPQPPKK